MSFAIRGLAHVGIRVHDLRRAAAFYEILGFELVAGPVGPEPVALLHHPAADLEINLILNAPSPDMVNLLMDVSGSKPPGYTHMALVCDDLDAAVRTLEAAGFPIRERVTFPTGVEAVFVRDPDGNVVELDALPPGWTLRGAVARLRGG
ncbi:MAG: VOC family protein [Myxococcales bacterium]|nr:VOC family protein [Myxococcales bacterium]MCB9663421.1 VOC family protein [Alphaproteobacteria bacterium]